jgi:hypothetical protein
VLHDHAQYRGEGNGGDDGPGDPGEDGSNGDDEGRVVKAGLRRRGRLLDLLLWRGDGGGHGGLRPRCALISASAASRASSHVGRKLVVS